ncbi:TOBE domain-containing protein [Clostridium sp. Cult3]|uniref:TOBE domain-containing protein n=1 Tax=Clostridium sp. Cult3 TaxID=2079004 RepID=UPI001F223349|nr:TOBE domain-containing protein [Clostridium sp. Cult3]MCF6460371.1 molybdenum-pterin-binding protein [Clostridium sp. Cult3]
MQISARNQLKATIKEVTKGPVSTEIVLDVGGQTMAASITTTSANNLNLNIGDNVTALVKASSVMIMK